MNRSEALREVAGSTAISGTSKAKPQEEKVAESQIVLRDETLLIMMGSDMLGEINAPTVPVEEGDVETDRPLVNRRKRRTRLTAIIA